MNPLYYRPSALLNSVYKIVATHTNRELLAATIDHSIIHPTQFGGLPNRRCQDHILTFCQHFGSQTVATAFTSISTRPLTPFLKPLFSRC